MTRLISIPVMPPGVPVVRSTRVSALIWSGTWIARGLEGIGLPCQGRVHGDSLVGGQQCGEVGHAVGGRAQAHGPLRGGVARPLGHGARVPAGGGGPYRGDDGPGPGTGEGSGVGGEFLVDGGPVGHSQAGCFLHDVHGAFFVELAGVQGCQGVGHLGDQGLGHAEQPAAAVRGLAPGQRDLLSRARASVLWGVSCRGPQPTALGPALLPEFGLFLAMPDLEGDGKPCLLTGDQLLTFSSAWSLVDQPGTVGGEVDRQKGSAAATRSVKLGLGQQRRGQIVWLQETGPANIRQQSGRRESVLRKTCRGTQSRDHRHTATRGPQTRRTEDHHLRTRPPGITSKGKLRPEEAPRKPQQPAERRRVAPLPVSAEFPLPSMRQSAKGL